MKKKAPEVPILAYISKVPVLGVCYGAQLTAKLFGGKVDKSNKREYGRAILTVQQTDALFNGIPNTSQVWMSHSDSITALPGHFPF